MKIIFQQHMQFVRHVVNQRNEDHGITYYGTYTAYYAAAQAVLVCNQTVECYTSGALRPTIPPRKLIDINRRTSSDHHAQAVRDAVEWCDWYAGQLAEWCAKNSTYPEPTDAAQRLPAEAAA